MGHGPPQKVPQHVPLSSFSTSDTPDTPATPVHHVHPDHPGQPKRVPPPVKAQNAEPVHVPPPIRPTVNPNFSTGVHGGVNFSVL